MHHIGCTAMNPSRFMALSKNLKIALQPPHIYPGGWVHKNCGDPGAHAIRPREQIIDSLAFPITLLTYNCTRRLPRTFHSPPRCKRYCLRRSRSAQQTIVILWEMTGKFGAEKTEILVYPPRADKYRCFFCSCSPPIGG